MVVYRAEVFRPFQGYEDLRLVTESAAGSAAPTFTAYLQFSSAFEAALCMVATQGYKLYPKDKDKAGLALSFAKNQTAEQLAVAAGARPRRKRKRTKRRRRSSRSRSPRGGPRQRARRLSPPGRGGGYGDRGRDYRPYGRDMSRERRDRDRGRYRSPPRGRRMSPPRMRGRSRSPPMRR